MGNVSPGANPSIPRPPLPWTTHASPSSATPRLSASSQLRLRHRRRVPGDHRPRNAAPPSPLAPYSAAPSPHPAPRGPRLRRRRRARGGRGSASGCSDHRGPRPRPPPPQPPRGAPCRRGGALPGRRPLAAAGPGAAPSPQGQGDVSEIIFVLPKFMMRIGKSIVLLYVLCRLLLAF
jgi:hypothetical protein